MSEKLIDLEFLKIALDAIPEMVAIKDLEGRYVFANKRVDRFYKKRFDTIIGKTIEEIYPPEEQKYVKSLDERVIDSKKGFSENIRILTDDGYIVSQISRSPILDSEGNLIYIISIANDITDKIILEEALQEKVSELEELNKKYLKLSYYDTLTEIYNRRKFYEDLKQLEETISYKIILIDLNNFKLINDEQGHIIGDKALKEFANKLDSLISEFGGNSYRLGGDEFVIIHKSTSDFSFQNMVKDLNVLLKRYHNLVSLSYGEFEFEGKKEINKVYTNFLISRADQLLYKFKEQVKKELDTDKK